MSSLGRRISWLLRHGAKESGLAMDEAGFARIDDVIRVLEIDRAALDRIARDNDKQRLTIDGDRIRAAQGHSLEGTPVTLEALEASWSAFVGEGSLWHGTRIASVESIARDGILPAARTHVHLAASIESPVGKRSSVDVLLEVSPRALAKEGLRIFASENGVVLVRRVPASCIVDLRAVTRRARAQEAALRAYLPRKTMRPCVGS